MEEFLLVESSIKGDFYVGKVLEYVYEKRLRLSRVRLSRYRLTGQPPAAAPRWAS